jgi:hypothetical protein
MNTAPALLCAALLLTLGACKQEPAKKAAQGAGIAAGEVLTGSVSDAMIPVDTLRSQPPLAPKGEGGDKGDAKPGSKPAAKPSAAADSAAPAEPAAAPDAPEG